MKLLAAYSALATLPGVDPVNIFGQTILEELKGSFQARSKMSRETVLCMLQVTHWLKMVSLNLLDHNLPKHYT